HRPGQPVPARPHQHRPQPVQHRPRGRVGADLQRPLQALRRDSVLLGGEQPAGGEPHRQRRARAIEDRARRHRSAPMTPSALIPAITEPPAPRVSAGRAGETTRPAHPVQVVQAVCISAEPGLELASRPRVMGADTRLLHTPSLLRLSKSPRLPVIDAHLRDLRYFVAIAEELNFTRLPGAADLPAYAWPTSPAAAGRSLLLRASGRQSMQAWTKDCTAWR